MTRKLARGTRVVIATHNPGKVQLGEGAPVFGR